MGGRMNVMSSLLFPQRTKDRPIILMNTQGEVLQKLRTEPGHLYTFTWSPDRRSIAYEACQNANCQIYLMEISTNVRRHAHHQLTFNGDKNEWPAWSPNGKWIAFTSERAGDRDIYKMDVDGENVIRLTKERKCDEPVWSPDSRWIAFVSHHDATLFVMDAEGKNVRHLGKRGEVLLKCTWSPDGKQIAFISADIEDGIVYTIEVIDVDGQNTRQLTKSEKGTVYQGTRMVAEWQMDRLYSDTAKREHSTVFCEWGRQYCRYSGRWAWETN